jgi:hypothetical protein
MECISLNAISSCSSQLIPRLGLDAFNLVTHQYVAVLPRGAIGSKLMSLRAS